MARKKTFKEIRQEMDEITKRPPTEEQLEDLRNTFLEIERAEKEAERRKSEEIDSEKKIAGEPELGI